MLDLLKRILRTGIVSEPLPAPGEPPVDARRLQDEVLTVLGRALCIRPLDAGSCNGCELEIHALNNPYYNLEGAGIRFVASPRHADLLLVTGPVSVNMERPRRTPSWWWRSAIAGRAVGSSARATRAWEAWRR